MATNLDDFLDPEAGGAAPADPPAADPVPAGEAVGADPAPKPLADPAPDPDPPEEIPEDLRGTREALLAERAKRKDWKGQAERASGELTALRAELEAARKVAAAPPAPAPAPAPEPRAEVAVPNPIEDPAGYHAYNQRMLYNERLNMSEMMLRAQVDDLDEKMTVFKKAADANPALRAELTRQVHPYKFAYEHAKKVMAMEEVGDDPAAFRTKLEAEIRAKVEAEYAAAGNGSGADPVRPAALHIPRSLGTAPSSAPRMAAVQEVPEFEDIFVRPRKRG